MKFLSAVVSSLVLLALTPMSANAAAGDLDTLNLGITGTQVNAMALQPDGKMIIGGAFSQVLGVARANIARLNADGTLDATFDPKTNGAVNAVAVQSDGKVVVGGDFTTLQPNGAASTTTRYNLARVSADGTLEAGFAPVFNAPVCAIAMQAADGKILVGGEFQTVNGESYDNLVRLNTDGSLDFPFYPRPLGAVYCVAVQPNGDIVAGGNFPLLAPATGPNPTRRYVVRLTTAGQIDPVFDPRASSTVRCLALQADGKVLLGGDFTSLRPNGASTATTRNYVGRVNADGTLDASFNPSANAVVNSFAVQANGKVVLGGEFTTLSPNGGSAVTRNRIARLNVDGTLDSGFNPNANGLVKAVALQPNGRVLVGGGFTSLAPNGGSAATRNYFARLLNDVPGSLLVEDFGALIYSGTFAGGGTLVRVGQPVVLSETEGTVTARRAVFIRRVGDAAAGISHRVSFSANLVDWEVSAATPTVLADNGSHQVVSVPFPALVGGSEARFFRVMASMAP